ncbi:PRKR-interacting protein 1 homolog [Drosophila tropicalis]|uniref:PRKR-interacting protein 1 homolog n=1 Tax=Drosophila tropicalis TaxID=46794 RepID=UPI0035ABD959
MNTSGKKTTNNESDDANDKEKPLRPFVKTATDLQRLKLEKLMKNPDKPVNIPEQRREKDYMASVPTFVRNVMGSSAGAGSGEFHVYRHLRRKEYARQKNIQHQSAQEAADSAFQQKLEDNRRSAEEKTAKKRAKRLKKKQRAKRPREQKQQAPSTLEQKESESSGSASESEEPCRDNTEESKEDTLCPVADKSESNDEPQSGSPPLTSEQI